ncbi:MAG: c-type cytochrome [Hymenobacter sp.]|nr:MAG: c-type cytochrome [Hymenobacter sp.]
MTATERANSQDNPDAQPSPLNQDSASATKLTAVDNQMQVDTNASKIGTAPVGKPAGKGAQLVAASDCGSCHRENEKLLGPAYHAVALKYPDTPANVAMLSQHIINGGAGHWGDIAMTPHPGLSESDAKEMVRYVLSLK